MTSYRQSSQFRDPIERLLLILEPVVVDETPPSIPQALRYQRFLIHWGCVLQVLEDSLFGIALRVKIHDTRNANRAEAQLPRSILWRQRVVRDG